MKTKLQAFTILEMLLSMLVVSVIISIGYSMYANLNQQIQQFMGATTSNIELWQWQHQLEMDFHNAENIRLIKAQHIEISNYQNTKVSYHFTRNQLVRKQEQRVDYLDCKSFSVVLCDSLSEGKSEVKQVKVYLDNDSESLLISSRNCPVNVNPKTWL